MKTWIGASAAVLGLGACSTWNAGTHIYSGQVGDSQYVATTADLRFVLSRQKQPTPAGTTPIPGTISTASVLCAEPSPDVAKALSDALSANANASAQGLKALGGTGASVTVAQSLAATQNASLITLGSRLATTQLMRDGVYRLCEAYANGAISSYEYGMVLSRYGDTMVTLLAIEALSGIATSEAGQTISTTATPANPASGGGAANTPGANAGANGGTKGGANGGAGGTVQGDSGSGDGAHITDNAQSGQPASPGVAPTQRDAVDWSPTRGGAQDPRHTPPRPYLTPIVYNAGDAPIIIKTAAPPAAASGASSPLPTGGVVQPTHVPPHAANPQHAAAAKPASGTTTKKNAKNAKPSGSGAQNTATGTANNNTSTAAAIVKLQENYLAQSVHAPVIVLCTQVLAENLDNTPDGQSLKNQCNALMTAYVKQF
jgi:hypothetical protein